MAAYRGDEKPIETEDDCVDRRFRKFAEKIEEFPTGATFSWKPEALSACVKGFTALTPTIFSCAAWTQSTRCSNSSSASFAKVRFTEVPSRMSMPPESGIQHNESQEARLVVHLKTMSATS